MAIENKGPVLAILGAIVGMLVVGSINSNYTILGALFGAIAGYFFGTQT